MEKSYYELTNPQKSIWYTENFFDNTSISNICGVLKINQTVEFDILEKALNIFIEKNDSFRIRISVKNDLPVQYVENFHPFNVPLDLIDTDDDLLDLGRNLSQEIFSIRDSRIV